MGPPRHRRVTVLARPLHHRRLEIVDRFDHEVARADEGDGHCGVDHVVGGEPVVDPLGGGATDALLHHVDERRRLVVGDGFARPDRLDVEIGPIADRGGVGRRHHTQLRPRLCREDLDLEPGPEAGLVGEEPSNLRGRVAVYQGDPSSCRTGTKRGWGWRTARSTGPSTRLRSARSAASRGARSVSCRLRATTGRSVASRARS